MHLVRSLSAAAEAIERQSPALLFGRLPRRLLDRSAAMGACGN
jgi:hypothetical protein